MERIYTTIGATAFPVLAAEFITNSISTALLEFTHDPVNGCTLDIWFNRYENVMYKDGSTLDEAARADASTAPGRSRLNPLHQLHLAERSFRDIFQRHGQCAERAVRTQHANFRPSPHLPGNSAQQWISQRLSWDG
ncbi:unnamed protein product [Toxocara canis]|uniref:HTH_48 domain-containing protein n=1 Tax=Toxocara canis TaxID=6265 RepID=A0A183VBX8_TOXCA|nr:unnamed protein product [Toxocara canis]